MKLHQTNHRMTLANFLHQMTTANFMRKGSGLEISARVIGCGPKISLATVRNPILVDVYGALDVYEWFGR